VATAPDYASVTGTFVSDYVHVPAFLLPEVSDDNARWLFRESSLLVGV